ncbi:MAG: hypothetical protein EZS28_001151 [Streblomastix strix]|uniref:Uncharacterized protein n=1 Tax=Streblomastix strix TaxID=222440 RepID=A0A5J4X8W0_9EUKA|nr:MAG: hypothetical protein EZS28_001151 [Streblomastix strix]
MSQGAQNYYEKTAERVENSEQLRFWLGFSTACGTFHQFQLMLDATALWETSIYAREQAVISYNSLNDLCTINSVSVSSLESIISGKSLCGIFNEICLFDIDTQAASTPWYFKIPFDITFNGVLALNQLNLTFDSFPDLNVVWLNKQDTVRNQHLVYHMIPPEKPDTIYLLAEPTDEGIFNYMKYNVRIVNIYLDPTKASITPMLHYLCDAFIRITFDNNSDPQVLNIDVIGEIRGSTINTG